MVFRGLFNHYELSRRRLERFRENIRVEVTLMCGRVGSEANEREDWLVRMTVPRETRETERVIKR